MSEHKETLARLSASLADVLTAGQRADLERVGGEIVLHLSNTQTMRGVTVAPCRGCDACRGGGLRHLSFTPFALELAQ